MKGKIYLIENQDNKLLGLFGFFKIKIVCKDDEIPAFSAMIKMGLNYLHLTNWLCERNIFGLVWLPCMKICLT